MEGWISLHRQILEWEWYTDFHTKDLFIHLLLKANHQDNRWKGILVQRGQVITGRKQLAKELGFSEQSIRTSLNKLKSTNEITIEATKQYSVVTIVNYEKFQASNFKSTNDTTNRLTNNQPTTNQQLTTNNNDNNDNNIYLYLFNKYKKDIDKNNFSEWMKANRKLKEDESFYKLSEDEQDRLFNY